MNDDRNARIYVDHRLAGAGLASAAILLFVFAAGNGVLLTLAGLLLAAAVAMFVPRRTVEPADASHAAINHESTIVPIDEDAADLARYADFYASDAQQKHFSIAANADYAGDERRRDGRPWSPADDAVREDHVDDISASNDDGWTEL